MKEKLCFSSQNFYIDESLTEQPEDRTKFIEKIHELELQNSENDVERGKLASRIGVLYRIYGDLQRSEMYIQESLNILHPLTNKTEFYTARIRLAQTYQKQKKSEESKLILNEVEKECDKDPNLFKLKDFALQHSGKLHFDNMDYQRALEYFKEALEIRLNKGEAELISSTKFAIKITEKKIKLRLND